jgi:hypothetical protein
MKLEDIEVGQTVAIYGTVEETIPGETRGAVKLRLPACAWPHTIVALPEELHPIERKDDGESDTARS